MNWKREIREPRSLRRHDADVRRNALQNLDLADDDGLPVDDEPALVASAEPPSLSAGEDRGADRVSAHG